MRAVLALFQGGVHLAVRAFYFNWLRHVILTLKLTMGSSEHKGCSGLEDSEAVSLLAQDLERFPRSSVCLFAEP